MTTRFRLLGGGLAIAALLLAAAPAGAGSHKKTILHGTFNETTAGAGLGYDIHGSAKLTVSDGSTVAKVNISGLDPAKLYGSHVHDGVCGSADGHYQHHPDGGTAHGTNEIHLFNTASMKLGANRGGVAHATTSVGWAARTASPGTAVKSIVVHEPGSGARIACANLT